MKKIKLWWYRNFCIITNKKASSQTERMYSEKDYIHSHTDAIAFMSHLQHNTLYEVLDLANNKWDKQKYTFLVDKNEQEETQKMIHSFRMGWIKKLKNK